MKFKNLKEVQNFLDTPRSVDKLGEFSTEAYLVFSLERALRETFMGTGESSIMTSADAKRYVKTITAQYRRGFSRLPRKYIEQIVHAVAGRYLSA